MSHKLIGALVGLLAATVLTGTAFGAGAAATPTAWGTGDMAPVSASRSTVNAGASDPLVTMPPQSNLKLLSHATLIGSHAQDATIELTVSLKLRHTVKLKKYLSQANYQPVTPREFSRLYGPTKAQVARVEGFLEAHRIQVLNVSPDRTLIHTEATTLEYEHALDIQINDYTLNGRRFYSTSDSPKIPTALAPLVLGILGLNHDTTMRLLHHTVDYIKNRINKAS